MTNRQLRTTLNLPLYRRLISSNWYSYQLNKKRYCGSNPKMKRAILQVFLMIVVIFVWNGVIDQLKEYQVDIRHGVMVTASTPIAIAYVSQVSEAESQVSAEVSGVEDQIRTIAKERNFDAELLTRIAFCESSFNPKATNGTSSATGLFQILDMHGLTVEERMDVEISTNWAINKINGGGLNAWNASKHCWNN